MREATLGRLLRAGAARLSGSASPALDARAIARKAFGLDGAALIACENHVPADAGRARFDSMIARRLKGEPVAHIVGEKEFWSLPIALEPGVLVPRADSEALIEAIVRRRSRRGAWRILDLGCGSGALLAALLASFPQATGIGVDFDRKAALLAARNLRSLGFGARASILAGDWTKAIGAFFDIVVSNPPYIPAKDWERLPREVRDFEDARALLAGPDGLESYREILDSAPLTLAPEGLFVLEIGDDHEKALSRLAGEAFPAALITAENDLSGRPRALTIDLGAAAK